MPAGGATWTTLLALAALPLAAASVVDFRSRSLRSWGRELAAEGSAGECPLATGGNCYIFGCADSRGGPGSVECNGGHCLCKPGFCALQGTCVVAPSSGEGDDEQARAMAPIRLTAHPDKCLATVGQAVLVQDCGSTPEVFSLPVGGIGQIRRQADAKQCLAVVAGVGGERIVIKECSLVAGSTMQFVLPGGALGLVRWRRDPRKCLAVVPPPPPPLAVATAGLAAPVAAPEPSIVGAQLLLRQCQAEDLLEQFGTSDEAPAPFMPCTSSLACAQMEADSVLQYCLQFPSSPSCAQYRRCPPGGCNNGACDSGYCKCNAGFYGESCEQAVHAAVPLASAVSNALLQLPPGEQPLAADR